MAESNVAMECQEYEAVPEEVVETSYMCGECFLLFPTTEEFNVHQCEDSQVGGVENVVVEQAAEVGDQVTDPLNDPGSNPCVWEARESEAAMEEAVANILGEKLKKMAPQRLSGSRVVEFEQTLDMPEAPSIEHTGIVDHQMESVVEHTVENKDSSLSEIVEIPSTNVYMYDNPVYLNRLMKDNTFGRRVRHDAPYRLRLGPWDNKSSRLLIKLLKEYPKAYFILDKECKRTEAWEMIRNRMAEAGYQFTVLQIRMRWRELVKTYRTTINYNDLHNVRRSCQFFEELNDLFGVWDYTSTLILIRQMELHGSKRLGQNGGTRMRFKVWNHIHIMLEAQGYNFNADQVQGRWSTLVNLYQRMVENNSKPHTEKITMAYREHMELVFSYYPERNAKWQKIMEKRGKTPRNVKRNWTHPIERELLTLYRDRIYRFNNEHINNNELWEEIVQELKENTDYSSTADKVRIRFSELTKQFTTVEQHNSQSGTIRRECKHHELLSEIYSVYNYWPHDKSTIKLNKSNALRMRQVNAQLAWNEDQSRAVLQLYPQVLVNHISGGDHQPIEEFWLQLAKAYLNMQNDRKQCYEIEEHIALLRRGYHSRNPFPFCAEMQLLEETEATLGFSPEPVVTDSDQLIPYWSHSAAILLLDLVIAYRQDGLKNVGLFEMISRDLANNGYRYTGEECRVYYFLLRQLYTNRLRTLKRNRELLKPFPYMDKMAEVDSVVSLPRFVDNDKNRKVILSTAAACIQEVEGETEEEKFNAVLSLLSRVRFQLRQKNVFDPLPSVKKVGRILGDAISDINNDNKEILHLRSILEPYSEVLNVTAERTPSHLSLRPELDNKGEKLLIKKVPQPKYGGVQWTEANVQTLLEIIKEWRFLCHDTAEFESILGADLPVWREIAGKLQASYKICPNKCHERFSQLCREYKSVIAFNARLESDEPPKTVLCQNHLQSVLAPLVFHEGELDPRDECWANEESEGWGHYETVQLLFTVKELGSNWLKTDWEMVYLFMKASNPSVSPESCRSRYEELLKSYESAVTYNQFCNLKDRSRPPFYFKFKSLLGNNEVCDVEPDPASHQEVEMDELEVMKVLVQLLKNVKGNYCHSVPRRPLLLTLARLLDDHYGCSNPTFSAHQVWYLMVQLHRAHHDAAKENVAVNSQINLEELWQNHPSPLVAYNLLALPLPGWQSASKWNVEEVYLLIEAAIKWELQPRNAQVPEKTLSRSASESLSLHGYKKSPKQCFEQWQFLASTHNHGGYRNFADQLRVLHLISPSLLQIKPPGIQTKLRVFKCVPNVQTRPSVAKQNDCLPQSPVVHVKSGSNKKREISSKPPAKRQKGPTKVSDASKKRNVAVSAPGDVVSYVHINVPQQNRSVQVSTDELRETKHSVDNSCVQSESSYNNNLKRSKSKVISKEEEYQQVCGGTSAVKYEEETVITVNSHKTEPVVSHRLLFSSTAEVNETCESSCKKENGIKCLKGNSNISEESIKVDILKIQLEEASKVLTCRTRGASPQTFRLSCPRDFVLPSNLSDVCVPRTLAYPELTECSKKKRTSPKKCVEQSPSHLDNNTAVIKKEPPDNYLEIVKEEFSEEIGDKEHDISNINTLHSDRNDCSDENYSSGGHEISELLGRYRKRCDLERVNLVKLLQEIHLQQTNALENIFSLFQDIEDALDL